MKNSGAFGVDKNNLLNKFPKEYIPKHILVNIHDSTDKIIKRISNAKLDFPIVVKPNIGERGIKVEKIDSLKQLKLYFQHKRQYNTLIQEYIDLPIEMGIFYHELPISSESGITSITVKKFLSVTGDGKSTLWELIKKNKRTWVRIEYIKKKYKNKLDNVLKNGETLLLEPIGNHNRGTIFLNANFLINRTLIKLFENISSNIDGYYYGRYDIKVKSIDDLYMGKNLKIMELNGINSEPAHIYDPSYKLFQAYKDIFYHMKLIGKISHQNRQGGFKTISLFSFLKSLFTHLRNR